MPPPRNAVIWDPSCGRGNILDVCKDRGYRTIGSDIVDRPDLTLHEPTLASQRHEWFMSDQLDPRSSRYPSVTVDDSLQILCNPPFKVAEKFIRAVLNAPVSRASFLVPIAFLCSAERYGFFTQQRPSQIAILCERPSCPPGSKLDPYTTFTGGMQDYCFICYSAPHRWRAEIVWIKPS